MPRPPRQVSRVLRRGAFTLLEILIVLALIGLLSGVVVTGLDRMMNPGPESPAQAFWHAARSARRYALQHETDVRLSYDKDTGELKATALDGTELPPVKAPDGTDLVFISGLVAPTAATNGTNALVAKLFSSSITVGGDEPVDSVTFYRDGTCTLFRVQVETGGAGQNSAGGIIQVDPWTCSPMLVAQNTGGGGG